jgi:hypothetical protein
MYNGYIIVTSWLATQASTDSGATYPGPLDLWFVYNGSLMILHQRALMSYRPSGSQLYLVLYQGLKEEFLSSVITLPKCFFATVVYAPEVGRNSW